MDCKRKGIFEEDETHKCFVLNCDSFCYPAKDNTCPDCNFKFCEENHCACDLSEEARYALTILYETYCENCKEED